MDQLINEVTQRTGISPDQARTAVQTVLNFVKSRLPGQVASQLDSVVGGQGMGNMGNMGGMTGQAQQTMGGLGDTLGGNQP